jgi:hypothetical protein
VIGALLYCRALSLRNRLAAAVKRLRQPKYLMSFVAGAFYIYFFFFRRMHFPAGRGTALEMSPALVVELGGFVLLAFLFVNTIFIWSAAAPEARLKFSEAEIAFLFPAPLSRRRLIHFNLLSAEVTVLFSSLLLTLIFDRFQYLGGNAFTHAVGWWLILSTISLFQNAMRFAAAQAIERFGPTVKRRALSVLAVLALVAIRGLYLTAHAPGKINPLALGDTMQFLVDWLHAGIGAAVDKPFAWVVAPFAAPTAARFLLALGPALLVPAVCYATIVSLQVSFREGSIATAEMRSQQKAAQRASGSRGGVLQRQPKAKRSPFKLHPSGRPEMAFLWKNLIGIQSWFNLRIVFSFMVVCLVVVLNLTRHTGGTLQSSTPSLVLTLAAIGGFYVVLLGPQLVRQDLRSDLHNADLLKAYPIRGWQIVGGQMLTPALLLSLLLWVASLAAGWAFLALAHGSQTFTERLVGLFCVWAIIPPVTLLQLVIPNGAALLFPAWHQNTRTRGGGIEAIGQRLIFTFGQFLAVVVALIPAAVAAPLIVVAAIGLNAGTIAGLLAATLFVLAVVTGEVWVGLWWLGGRFEKLDIALELKP